MGKEAPIPKSNASDRVIVSDNWQHSNVKAMLPLALLVQWSNSLFPIPTCSLRMDYALRPKRKTLFIKTHLNSSTEVTNIYKFWTLSYMMIIILYHLGKLCKICLVHKTNCWNSMNLSKCKVSHGNFCAFFFIAGFARLGLRVY